MKDSTRLLVGSFSACLCVLGGCASIPRSDVPQAQFGQLSCSQLAGEIAQTEETKRVAAGVKSDSWKAVVPFVVVARYADAAATASDADQRIANLRKLQLQKGCAGAAS